MHKSGDGQDIIDVSYMHPVNIWKKKILELTHG